MQPSPPVSIELRHFGLWRTAVIGVAVLTLAALYGWSNGSPEPVAGAPRWAVAFALAAVVSATGLLRLARPVSLRWDGHCWHLGPLQIPGKEPRPGQLTVAIDLGGWMLLRFVPNAGPRRARWLPAQRRGVAAQWHALRCAVYSPRPAPGALTDSAH
jgi:hypothetical protein